MDFQQLRRYCLAKPGAIEDFPFGDDTHVIKVGGKMFALLTEKEQIPHISLKGEPEFSELLRAQYDAVKPGYHLNKRHWNTAEMDGSLPEEEVKGWIDLSYQLVVKGLKKAVRDELLM
ncbi:hypothetical protein T458_15275 [Brevibacillus panacihumi W25]|uniref:MmcQ-like protein n=1 Tax=Brevibacillus panacihumi W25 TaxID=1408254 RepID=V6M0Z6_9BACL|nr:MmcQ/YjbR family DNA-binding protein [Brevibacillus panacihumi]EST52346.1 hypothetical protein T458_15275 [Brevibacillus panacihumi W25]